MKIDWTHGRRKRGPYGGRDKSGPYGGRDKSGPYGGRDKSGPYGGRDKSGPYKSYLCRIINLGESEGSGFYIGEQ
jgi:hypothetical protein